MSFGEMVMTNYTKSRFVSKDIIYTKQDIIESAKQRFSVLNSPTTIIIPHVCNNINVFGAGFAHYIGEKFPAVKENFHLLGNKSTLGYSQYVTVANNNDLKTQIIVCNMIAQNGVIGAKNHRPLNYAALVFCMNDIRSFIKNAYKNCMNDTIKYEIHAPKFGSGLAGGNWSFIENLIQDIWSDIVVYIHVK